MEASRRGRRGLLGLPSELRSHIYDFALFHERSDGIIAPYPDCLKGYNLPPDSATLVDEHLLITEHASLQVFEQSLWNDERPGKIFEPTPVAPIYHLCTVDCLVRPPLTKVNRQIREEALRVFYSIDKFHFEMRRFELANPFKWYQGVRSPVD